MSLVIAKLEARIGTEDGALGCREAGGTLELSVVDFGLVRAEPLFSIKDIRTDSSHLCPYALRRAEPWRSSQPHITEARGIHIKSMHPLFDSGHDAITRLLPVSTDRSSAHKCL